MDLTILKSFKYRYFVLFFVVSFIVIIFISLFFQNIQAVSEWVTFFFSLALLGYVWHQTKKLNITYSENDIKLVMSSSKWMKYLTLTTLLQISSIAISLFFLSFVYLTLEGQLRDLFYFALSENQVLEASWIVYVLFFINICILAPLWEELFFRGVLLRRFMLKWSPQKSIVISAIIFGLIHINPITIGFAFCFGCLLGYVYVKTKSIVVPMVLHSFNNLLAFLHLVYINESTTELLLETDIARIEMIVSGIVGVLLTITLLIILFKNYKHIRGLTSNVKNADMPLE